MNLSVGIVGLPNVGKSTLFNALLKKQQALAANYPFTTIEPNIGVVPVPDNRLQVIAEITAKEIASPAKTDRNDGVEELKLPPIKPAMVNFVDIAGLVKGASEGAGLGNKFLSHIREVSVICHVVRAFSDENVIKEGSLDPKSDYETINTELALADLNTISKINPLAGGQKSKIPASPAGGQIKYQKETAEKLFEGLNRGLRARDIELSEEEYEVSKQFFLISQKPEIVVLNVSEEDYIVEKIPQIIEQYKKLLFPVISSETRNPMGSLTGVRDDNMVVICAKIESELAVLSDEEQKEYLKDLGLESSGLERLIKKAYEQLGLISFLTAGEKEVRAWTMKQGSNAVEAAGVIHTDFTKKFIKAEVVSFEDFVENSGWKGSREKGKARLEGRDYIVTDGDIIEFKIGA